MVVACFNAFWRLGRADWKVDESLDGAYAWEAVKHGNWSLEDGHPVFVRWFLGAGQLLFGQNRVGIRIAPALASVAAVVLLYVVGRALVSWHVGLLAAALWAVLPRALVLGHAAVGPVRGDRYGYLEPFMVVALLGATLTGWRWAQRAAWRYAVGTGALVGLAVAFKPTAVVVLLPISVAGLLRGRPIREVLPQIAAMAGLTLAVLVVTYLPLGGDAFGHLREVFRYQIDHSRGGHILVVDGKATTSQPHWDHLLYQWRGMGSLACVGLLIGLVGAWVDRSRFATRYVAGIWATVLGYHLISPVALPHYYLLWAPFSVLLAAMGLDRLLRDAPSRSGARTHRRNPPQAGVSATSSALTPLRVLGLVGVGLLASAGLIGTVQIATLDRGDYGRMTEELARRGVTATAVRYQGEAVDRYFPHAESGQIGFSDPSAPFDVLVLDPRDVPMLVAGTADEVRQRAAALGLTSHRIGRLEVWYRDPPG